MKLSGTILQAIFVLTFACCNMHADPAKILVLIDLDQSKSPPTNVSKLSPALQATKTSGGILKAADGSGHIVIALAPDALSRLKNEPFVKSVTSDLPPNVTPIKRLKISYEPEKAPTTEDLRTLGLQVVETYERGSFLIAEPRDGMIDARLISDLELNRRIRYVTPVLQITAALSDKP
jgi:hypothetical protein